MTPAERSAFQRAIQNLGFGSKTHLTRSEIERLIEELNLSREYKLADYVRSMDPAAIAALLR